MKDYYLHHMGIERWVLRVPNCSLMVIGLYSSNNPLDRPVELLYQRMLQSIGLRPDQVTTMPYGVIERADLTRLQPPAILLFEPARNDGYGDIPVVSCFHPAYLLEHPSTKKRAYQDLLRLHHLLAS